MRRLMALGSVAALVVCMLGGGAAATPHRLRVYEGSLSEEGATIQFELVKREGRPMLLRSMRFGVLTLTCDDGSVQGSGMSWIGGLPELPSHALDLDYTDDIVLHIHGTIQAEHGSGTLSVTIAWFTQDEQVQTCSSGELTWAVDRVVSSVESHASSPPIQVRHFVTATGAHVTMTGGNAAAIPSKPRIYEGPLDEEGAMARFELLKKEGRPLAMRSMSFDALRLTCDIDGSVLQWGFGWEWRPRWIGGLPELPSHALDMDEVDDMVLHLHGAIHAVGGSGTLSIAVGLFTQDEQVQTCSTGELMWTVDRTVPPVESPAAAPAIQVMHLIPASGTRSTLIRVA